MTIYSTSHREHGVNVIDYEGTDLIRALLIHELNVDVYGNAETVRLDDANTVLSVTRTEAE